MGHAETVGTGRIARAGVTGGDGDDGRRRSATVGDGRRRSATVTDGRVATSE
jgi:hypothetical protein